MSSIERTPKLYVVGNGFDLHHGLPTRFDDFKRYLVENSTGYPDHADTLQAYLSDLAENWSNLEAALASLDTDTLREYAGDSLISYAAEEWTDAYHHDYQFEIEQVLEALSTRLFDAFAEWIRTVSMPRPGHGGPTGGAALAVDPSASFLSFNYTETLTQLYGVPEGRVTHIHGSRLPGGDPIILGHGWKPPAGTPGNGSREDEERDPRVQEGEALIRRYFHQTQKPTAEVLRRHRAFFGSLADIEEVVVWGHSLSETDREYFEAIADATAGSAPHWSVSYFTRGERAHHAAVLGSLGVPEVRRTLQLLPAFDRST